MMIPRIMGKVGPIEEPEEIKGKWAFELWVTELGGGEEHSSLGVFGPWDTEEIAHKELRKACQLACEVYEHKIDGKTSGKYIDMKTNSTRFWDKRNEH